MNEFEALFSALEGFVNDEAHLQSSAGGGVHPGEHLLALAELAREALQNEFNKESDEKREWFSAKELANMEGMPKSISSVSRKASIEGWKKRNMEGVKGIAFEYHIESFPEKTKKHLSKLHFHCTNNLDGLAERLAHVANDSWALSDQLRDDLRCAAKIIAK